MSNNHKAAAERVFALCETGHGMSADQQLAGAAMAQTQATLALAYEQRTANLIAAFGNMMDGDSDTFLGERIDGYELAKEITERLGL